MARTNSISIFEDANTQAKLNEIQAGIVENLQKNGNSFRFKSQNANLEEKAGSYNFKRFVNSQSREYGTARTAGAGDKITAPEITVNIDDHKEIVEEIAKFDAERFGVDKSAVSIIEKRKTNHEMTLKKDIERKFWQEAYLKAIIGDDLGMKGQVKPGVGAAGNTPIDEYLDSVNFVALETVKNDYVDGVDRDLIGCVVSPTLYSKLKSRINTLYNANFAVADKELQGINGVAIFNEHYLPKKVESITLVKEALAQPLSIDEYQGERIPLSNDYAIELFYDKGTKALAADLIVVGIELDATHTKVELIDELPGYDDVATDTIYILTEDVTVGSAPDTTTYKAGDMYTATKTAPSTVTWTKYNA